MTIHELSDMMLVHACAVGSARREEEARLNFSVLRIDPASWDSSAHRLSGVAAVRYGCISWTRSAELRPACLATKAESEPYGNSCVRVHIRKSRKVMITMCKE